MGGTVKRYIAIFSNDNILRKMVTLLFLVYVLFMLYVCFHVEAKVPDEIWFWNLSREISWNHSIIDVLLTQNYLGYGAFYWQLLKIIKSFLVLRLLWASMLISIPICILVFCRKILDFPEKNGLTALLLYLSCPLSWFTGKIIGPEILSQFLGCWGSFVLFGGYKKSKFGIIAIGSFIMGIASGIKLYNGIFTAFCGLYVLQNEIQKKSFKTIFQISIICLGAFLFGFVVGGGL